ncbi:ThiJ/PfpI family protein [Penicillium chermesinum]|uniref:D-lactate dehydratase n=1 Tax=Penicillium chermesinum TaxID=63820 RepID=A0A9W9NIA4_9EURO|nr:ThiJ/PfpI family protein [Penicillium chermesinum]KAJ5220288.1 ThiJ/PfpI family protein [Penicillium chermesinum]
MAPKVLIVLTSADEFPGVGKTGWYLPEFAHPWEVLHSKTELTIASPKGGAAPLDQGSVEMFKSDPVSQKFLAEQKSLWENTVKLSDVNAGDFDAIFYVGGHGPLFDLTDNATSLSLIQAFAAAKKPVSAVCHGPTVFLKATTPDGKPLIAGASVTGFSNVEEEQVGLLSKVPFELETELQRVSDGGYVKAAEPWAEKVVVSKTNGIGGPLITGQNPNSGSGVAKAILEALGI